MPGAWTQLYYHIVFSTKSRRPYITRDIQPRLYEYLGGAVRGQRGSLQAIGGVEDHVHLLIRWRTDASIADLMRGVKGQSTKWAGAELEIPEFEWQDGYAAFSVSASMVAAVEGYIASQEEHHMVRSFAEELELLLKAHGVEYDPKYLSG